jgi:hypothetical protein
MVTTKTTTPTLKKTTIKRETSVPEKKGKPTQSRDTKNTTSAREARLAATTFEETVKPSALNSPPPKAQTQKGNSMKMPEIKIAKEAPITPEMRYQMICEAAYYRAEQRGFTNGDPEQDWIEAEAEVDQRLNKERK